MIGYYIDLQNKNPSKNIRYLKILNYLNHPKIELYKEENLKDYKIVLFCKAFSDKSLKKAYLLKKLGKKIYFDICDNYFYNPNNLSSYCQYKKMISEMLNLADKVILSSDSLKKEVLKETPNIENKITIINDTYEIDYNEKNTLKNTLKNTFKFFKYICQFSKNNINIIWFGNAHSINSDSGIKDIILLKEILEKFSNKRKKLY